MRLSVNRKGDSIAGQLAMQIAMRIISGQIARNEKLPSVRALATQLGIHRNTVSVAYKKLQDMAFVTRGHGSGVFVTRGAARGSAPGDPLETALRQTLQKAAAQGYSLAQIRTAFKCWASEPVQSKVVVVDENRETAVLFAAEIGRCVGLEVAAMSVAEANARPERFVGVVTVTVPVHLGQLPPTALAGTVAVANVEFPMEVQGLMQALAPGSIVLAVSMSADMVRYALELLPSLRKDGIIVECHLASSPDWRRLVSSADLVLTDMLTAELVRKAGARRPYEVRLISPLVAAEVEAAATSSSLRACFDAVKLMPVEVKARAR
jgi:DNA-binding transcriptional regulator YhcF (GntR family)